MNHESHRKHERGEEAAHRGRFALPWGGIRCKHGGWTVTFFTGAGDEFHARLDTCEFA